MDKEISRRLLRNGINKMDVNRVDIKVLLMHCWRLGGPEGLPAGPPTVKGPIQVWSMSPSLEGFKKKNQKAKITIRNQI